jgi:sodium/bile acid cotransporter 7
VFILLLSPLAALLVLQVPLMPREFAVGLAVFCCMPTTLTSGVSLTQVRLPPL